MRETIYRGKRVDNGEWVNGKNIICFKNSKTGEERFHIMPSGSQISASEDVDGNVFALLAPILHVTTSTIGQSTGMTDMNGNEIFEGDIVKISHGGSTYYAKIEWDDGSFWVTNHDIQMPSYISEVSKTYLEVIGNIHDNPELLEVTE